MERWSEKAIAFLPPGLSWRLLETADLAIAIELAKACLEEDGGLLLGAEEDYVRENFLPLPSGTAVGGFDQEGSLIAAAAVRPTPVPGAHRSTVVGSVHPGHRGRGLGAALMKWAVSSFQRELADCASDHPHELRATSETVNDATLRLLGRHGFMPEYLAFVLQRDLGSELRVPAGPRELTFLRWDPALAGSFFAAYENAYRDRPGFPGWSQSEWLAWLEPDDEDGLPEATLLAECRGEPVGFVACARILESAPEIAWVVQVGVVPAWRRQGIGASLMLEALRRSCAAGATRMMLDVATENHGALKLYETLGFECIGRRGHFIRKLT
ncbi:MAG: GNAT family N-acetyltransferase [Candidatus Bipolaricaulota bacterium]|nr:MAG: GNAT family N-acetyltransferase [Candidatus Bipolaricaulota bacterium]